MQYNPNKELYHHGILGMKWGVRRYQNKDGSLTAAGRKHLGYEDARNGDYVLKKYTSPIAQKAKSVGISALFTASRVAASVIPGYALIHNSMVLATQVNTIKNLSNSLDGKDYTRKEGDYEKIKDLPKKSSSTVEQDVKEVNKRLGKEKGKVNNCGYCSVAMEMRRRGYDVVARSKAYGIVDSDLEKWYKNPKLESPNITKNKGENRKQYANRAYNQVCNNIEKYGNGARGYISLSYEGMKSGHAMYWEVQNNKVTIYDAQSGKYGSANDKILSLADPSSYTYARLDNLKINDQITETCRSNPRNKKE